MPQVHLELPTIQNWSCHNCSGCCRQHGIFITEEERQRIESQNWTAADGIPADQPIFEVSRGWSGRQRYRLAQQPDGACVFLDEQGLCRIHGKFGEPAKPLACRIYPYAFHPAGNKVVVSLRFSCPSVAENRGQPVTDQTQDLQEIADKIVPDDYRNIPPPRITKRVQLDWSDTWRIVNRLDETVAEPEVAIAVRLQRMLFWIDLIAQTNFQKIRGARLDELLDLILEAARGEISDPDHAPESPPAIGLTQFRLLAGQYARKDTFSSARAGLAGRWQMLTFALRLASGAGSLPELSDELRSVPIAELEGPLGGVPPTAEEMLTRYYRVKLQGLHFCGRAYYGIPLVEGLHSLVLTFPAIMWLARWRAVSAACDRVSHDDVVFALTLVDHQHGFSDAFGTWGFRKRVQTLAQMGGIKQLISWYSRSTREDESSASQG